MLRLFVVVLGLVGMTGIFEAAATPASDQHVVLISLDGFRHDYIEHHQASELARIARQGVRAKRLTPVFPANTFPNHLSLITGLLPANHGVVNNEFLDKQRPQGSGYARYHMGKGYKDSSWLQGVPLWTLAELQGNKAASYFWPEADARFFGTTPTYHYHYSKHADYQQRIDQIISWLRLPAAARPQFIAGYFSLVDTIGHDFGPDSVETFQAVQTIDALMGQLYDRLQQLPIDVNLVVVSDHGMLNVQNEDSINIAALNLSATDFSWVNEGSQLHIYARPDTPASRIDNLQQQLRKQAHSRFQVLDRRLRQRYAMQAVSRSGDILLQAAAGRRFVDAQGDKVSPGGHGYLPEHPDMGALFIASGPAFKTGKHLPAVHNLEVYPALAQIMGLTLIAPIDGKLEGLAQGLVSPEKSQAGHGE